MSLERDMGGEAPLLAKRIMARFIDLRDASLFRFQMNEINQKVDDGTADRIDPAVSKDYEANRISSLEFPLLAFQSAKTQEETAEKIVAQCFPFSGIADPEDHPGRYKLTVAMFVTFCDAAVRARSYEIALELQRHPETGQESTEG